MATAATFDPLRAQPEPAFFRDASENKLHKWRLDDAPRPFTARLRPSIVSHGVVRLDETSFGGVIEAAGTDRFSPVVPGTLLCFNTIEEFKACDKKVIIANAAALVVRNILSGAATEDPGALGFTLALVHLGIKSHRYVIWPAFPAVTLPSENSALAIGAPEDPVAFVGRVRSATPAAGDGPGAIELDIASQWRAAISNLIDRSPRAVLPAVFGVVQLVPDEPGAAAGDAAAAGRGGSIRCVTLGELEELARPDAAGFAARAAAGEVALGVADAGASRGHAGWTARNALLWAALRLGLRGSPVSVLCLRPAPDGGVTRAASAAGPASVVLCFRCPAVPEAAVAAMREAPATDLSTLRAWCAAGAGQVALASAGIGATGWEMQPAKGKATLVPRPRVFDLASLMDERALVETAARLNLSLMKWRVMPALRQAELEAVSCLLLGAGTLGCHVARCLMGWGVRSITFVDNGRVSYSNPVRQPLFEFDDVAGPGGPKHKAEAAASAMRRIFPASRASGRVLTIPMPGHAEDVEQSLADAAALSDLIESHDVVFALTDTRESRWLPTALCRQHNKPLLNVALGFDSWLVMRHGVDATRPVAGRLGVGSDPGQGAAATGAAAVPASAAGAPAASEPSCGPSTAGCYFCADVVAPVNSAAGRTLDQQCTVTRPGLAPIAASHAVELLVNLLHHPLRAAAPTPERSPAAATAGPGEQAAAASAAGASPTGAVPHQLRGFIADFSVLKLEQEPFDCCSACSPRIIEALSADRDSFLRAVLADPDVLERLSGLERIKAEAEAMAGDWDDEDTSW